MNNVNFVPSVLVCVTNKNKKFTEVRAFPTRAGDGVLVLPDGFVYVSYWDDYTKVKTGIIRTKYDDLIVGRKNITWENVYSDNSGIADIAYDPKRKRILVCIVM